jgi:hypothetical protein
MGGQEKVKKGEKCLFYCFYASAATIAKMPPPTAFDIVIVHELSV